ncbi:MAG: class I SAM-dependent DNA methyltransferase [Stellaceae bacterium]
MAETFARYDTRGYRTVDVAEGYAAWAPFYDATMDDRLDLPLLSSLGSMDWNGTAAAVDLGCGTGRIGAWLKARGGARVDGVDSSPAMLERANAKGIYDNVVCADVIATGLAAGGYDLAISSFVVCHVSDLTGFYAEAARLVRPGGRVILIDYHPFMLLKGVPTHFNGPAGEPIAIVNVIHLLSDHVEAGRRASLSLLELREPLVDAEWVRQNPRMASHAGQPVSFAMVWVRE